MAPKRQPTSRSRKMAGKKGPAVQLQLEINTDEEWEQLMQRKGLIVVDVYSEWCGPCVGMVGNLKKVKLEIGGDLMVLAIAKSDNIEALKRFRNKSEPTWMFFGSGEYVNLMFGANSPELTKMLIEELEKERKAIEGLIVREAIPPGQMAKAEYIRWEATEKIRLEEEEIRLAEEKRKKEIKHYRLITRLKAFLLDVSIILHFDFATRPLPDPEPEPEEEPVFELEDNLQEEEEGEEVPLDNEQEGGEGEEGEVVAKPGAKIGGFPEEPEPEAEPKLSPLDMLKNLLKKQSYSISRQIKLEMGAKEVAEIFNVDPNSVVKIELEGPIHLKLIEKRREHLYYEDLDGLPYDPINKDNLDEIYAMVYGVPPPPEEEQLAKKKYFPHEEIEVKEGEEGSPGLRGPKLEEKPPEILDDGELNLDLEEEQEEEEEEIIDMSRQPYATEDSLAATTCNLKGLRSFYTPGTAGEKVNLIRKYFESFVSRYYEPEIKPPPPVILIIFSAHDRRPIHRLIETYRNNIMAYGYFNSSDINKAQLMAKKLRHYEALPYSIKKPFTDKLIVVINKSKEEPMLTFVNAVKPEYITPETMDGNEEYLKWFPIEEEKKVEEEDTKKRKKKAESISSSGDELEDDAPDYLLDSESRERLFELNIEELALEAAAEEEGILDEKLEDEEAKDQTLLEEQTENEEMDNEENENLEGGEPENTEINEENNP